ncbi:MAG TPA: hypothetical protein VIN66_11975 [Rheinheimera sp.]|uniref:hypothetical protein n=1 Tax=Rheinheimera sp. TaxID=1869214 RepID=UPI002F93655D
MVKKLTLRDWKNFREKFEIIVISYDDAKLNKKWKALTNCFCDLKCKDLRGSALKKLNEFFHVLPGGIREEFLNVRRQHKYEATRKKIRLLKETIASLESIMKDQELKNYNAAVSHLLANYGGVK